MVKVRIFVVTYKNNPILNDWALKFLTESDISCAETEIFVIGNHSEDQIDEKYQDRVTFIPNHLRPDFSTGHLARNWNQALMLGFGQLFAPQADIVVCMQNDTKVKDNWLSTLLEYHQTYDFYTCGQGDQFHSYTSTGVRALGLWDERFCNIQCQEFDYFYRALRAIPDKVSINDEIHKDRHHPLPSIIHSTLTGYQRYEGDHVRSTRYYLIASNMFLKKWGNHGWNIHNIPRDGPCYAPQHMLYPYFEEHCDRSTNNGYADQWLPPDPRLRNRGKIIRNEQ